jgi:uncharacterized protein (DUF305 family)
MMSIRRRGARISTVVLIIGVTLGVGGCAGTASSGTESASTASSASGDVNTGPHNAQDATFLQGMIPHHEQAIVMADMIPAMSLNPRVIALGEEIKAAQTPEINEMTSWLEQWNIPVDSSGTGSHVMPDGTVMGGTMMGESMGMMSEEQMAELTAADASRFDDLWLEMMIQHHEGAIDMSKEQLFSGENPQALALASAIISAQKAEIALMKKMIKES